MKPMTKAIAVALVQILLVSSLGAKLLYDRRTRPRAWFKAERYDPDLPIRGRYVSLQIEVNDPRSPEEIESKFGNELSTQQRLRAQSPLRRPFDFGRECGSIALRDDMPVAIFDQSVSPWNCGSLSFSRLKAKTGTTLRLTGPVPFFIPDTAQDPTRVAAGEELWVLATIPSEGPPRPITLGIKKANEGAIRPLKLN